MQTLIHYHLEFRGVFCFKSFTNITVFVIESPNLVRIHTHWHFLMSSSRPSGKGFRQMLEVAPEDVEV